MALIAMGLVASGCVHAIHRQHDREVLLSVSFTLADYSTFTFLTHPAVAQPLPPKQSMVLSTNGGTGFGIEAAPRGQPQHQVFFLYETRMGPNILTSAGATDRDFVKSMAPPKVNRSGLPCTSVSPFFIEGIGAQPRGLLAMRFYDSEGGNTYGVLDAAQHVLRARPVLVVSTKQIEPLWTRGGLYHIWIKSLFTQMRSCSRSCSVRTAPINRSPSRPRRRVAAASVTSWRKPANRHDGRST